MKFLEFHSKGFAILKIRFDSETTTFLCYTPFLVVDEHFSVVSLCDVLQQKTSKRGWKWMKLILKLHLKPSGEMKAQTCRAQSEFLPKLD
jgi:hypothetical protein